jgi:hypothetical protein
MANEWLSQEAANFLVNLHFPKIKKEVMGGLHFGRWAVARGLRAYLSRHPKIAAMVKRSSYTEESLVNKLMR